MIDEEPPSEDPDGRLLRCVRDLAAVQALPSMCIGRTFADALQILLEALPAALGADLVYLELPGAPAVERASAPGRLLDEREVEAIKRARPSGAGADGGEPSTAFGRMHWCEAGVPVGGGRGRLVAGRRAPFDPATDRVLVRSAANLVGTTLETANVLEAAQRKDEFMAMLGHELRNPLAPILTAVELLARHPEASREQQVISRNTRHLARLVDDLLDISRVTQGHLALRSEAVTLSTVLDRAVELAAPLVARNRHQLRVGDASGVMLRGDPVRLVQVFGNLLGNAAKFTPPEGRIEVAVARSAGRVRVSVQDSGRGISREHLGRIFEPFVQVDRERDALRGGLGLGLAIVRDLVQRHGGRIEVSSGGAGRGSTFSVELPTFSAELPTAPAEAQPQASAAPTRPEERRASCRVLVVDDNHDVAELLAEALELAGYRTSAEHDGRSALRAWRELSPHVGVFDVGLPDLDGYQLAREVRAEHGKKPVLIAATGYGQPRDRERATTSGFDLHLVKPVSVEELIVVLDERMASARAG